MSLRVASLFIASFASIAAAGPAFQNFVVQETVRVVPAGFTKVGIAPASQNINLRIALPSRDFAGLEKALFDVSTPSSSNYGNHLSKAEVNAFLAPSDVAIAAVDAWLASHNLIANRSSSVGDWLSVNVAVSKANEMLSAQYENFAHRASGKTYARTLSYSLPSEVADFVVHIHPTTTFNNPRTLRPVISAPKPGIVADATPASCATEITPACLQSLYGIPQTPATETSNSIAYANQADLRSFLKTFRPDISSLTTFTLQTLDGGSNPQQSSEAGIEANLDIQYTIGVATNVPVFFVSVGENFQDGDLGGFLDIVNFLSDEDNVPQVMTTSYGENETDMSKALAFKLCEAYAGFGARGSSILFASGDGSVEGGQPQPCIEYQAAFPAGCPFLTAVGSTHGISPETGSAFSSGGFSNYWGTPDYQADAVAAFLNAQGTTNSGLFNASGRGYPDVSAQGENVQIVSGGSKGGVEGTSCSSPIFASVIGLINDKLIAAGNPPLGFLNPWLYANPGMLNDVTKGSNPGCGAKGFTARAGWDPVTGLGTPNFAKMLAAAGL
ncbi:Family S53 protease [Mycena indigotica]|uniref:Family S53 protease n=1 Tax=Mycena indigotica TaxID=2126181 RepID=A0A8H6WBZ4_9AGAR|nr:Family S53 protease [Mycena indigotica]KAF7312317.1 Family S53 protease [Mycena indigotica]